MSRKIKEEAGSGASTRALMAGETMRRALAGIFTRTQWRDEALRGKIITVAEVRVAPDFSAARAYVMPLLGEGAAEVVEALNRCKSYIKREAARELKFRIMPDLLFVADDSFERGAAIERALAAVIPPPA
ncbi:hypothetical protein FACS1894186_8440 [Alphaproteobacteria bacterium]|nr:hypothetical protein FACS1894186_8440 [Alphaproteobacteria bacterium]